MKKVGFIGAGNMAGALIRGLLRAARYKVGDLYVSDAVEGQVRRLKRQHKVEGTRDNRQLVRESQTIILAVKPQIMDAVLDEIRPDVTPRKLFVSIAAGFPTARLEAGLGGQARVVRVMPNTPGAGRPRHVRGGARVARHRRRPEADAQAVQGGRRGARDHRRGAARRGDGGVRQRPRLRLLLRRGSDRGWHAAGLAQKLATQLAHATLTGAAAMLPESGMTARELREMVTSPGGTTLAGLTELEAHDFRDAVIAASSSPRAARASWPSPDDGPGDRRAQLHPRDRRRARRAAQHVLFVLLGAILLVGEPRSVQSDRPLPPQRDRAAAVPRAPVRAFVIGGIDLSPLVVILGSQFLRTFLVGTLRTSPSGFAGRRDRCAIG